MDETIPNLNNKVIGTGIAVIMLAVVLVPICNAFSNDGGSGSGDSAPVVQTLYKLDWDAEDYTVYTYTVDDFAGINYMVQLFAFEGEDGQLFANQWVYYPGYGFMHAQYIHRLVLLDVDPSEIELGNEFSVYKFTYEGESYWGVEILQDGEHIDGEEFVESYYPNVYTLSDTGLTDKIYAYCAEEYDNNMIYSETQYIELVAEDVWLREESDYLLSIYSCEFIDGQSQEEYFTLFTQSEGVTQDTLVTPTYIVENGVFVQNGILSFTYEEEEYNIEKISIYVASREPIQLVGGSDDGGDSDKGIAGTLIQFIPVFVALSILGAVAYMVVGRKDDEIIE